ncbi:mannitol repressor [Cellulophaga sp. RHA19]|uniref:MltR family transcriptional regulator n=1 Tax=Cellulophaga sp. RHA19 TaxID=1798237 RepID=UPI000C2C863A|nr:MltR family transcriptional regulator [Cellulophaga sp. RHA19]PKB43054.1 mannitol repressor [Cellulophaga sp. RHA19]
MDRIEPEPEMKELGEFLNSFNKESDRGAVLLAGSILDEWLLEIIESYLIKDKVSKELLLGFGAPLGTFSAKTKVAYSLGLIEKKEYEEINIIRKIRNEFGHSWKGVNFESTKIEKECNKLDWLGPIDDSIKRTNRSKFNFTIAILLTDLLWRKRLVKKEQLVQRKWTNKTR